MEDATITTLLAQLRNRVVLMIGDSSLRNQFVQLARIGLAFDRNVPVADAVFHGAHRGSFSLPWPIKQPEKPDSSNGFWGGFPWMVATTTQNVTLVYAKVWGCAELGSIVRKTRAVLLRHRQPLRLRQMKFPVTPDPASATTRSAARPATWQY